MTVPADNDDKWLHRLILDCELTDDKQVHPAAWERFRPDRRVPQFTYVLSGTSWKLGREIFLASAATAVDGAKLQRDRGNPNRIHYRGLIYQVVQRIRRNAGALALDVHIVGTGTNDPAHAILVTTAQLKERDGSMSPEVVMQLNQLFCIALANSPEERKALGP